MPALAKELTRRGLLDGTGERWAAELAAREGGALDAALLELDLVDEEELLTALEACHGLPAARWPELGEPDPGLGERLPEGFCRTFGICPWRLEGTTLVALVQAALPDDWLQELRDLFGLEVDARIAPSHRVSLERSRIFGVDDDPRAARIEARIARRRRADVAQAAHRLVEATSLHAAVDVVLELAEPLLEGAGFFLIAQRELHPVASRGLRAAAPVALPPRGSTLGAALEHGGFFAGPVARTAADRAFFESLGRPVPRSALVVPVPVAAAPPVVFLGDNGEGGIPARRVAELTLLVSRLGRHGAGWDALRGGGTGAPAAAAAPARPAPAEAEAPAPPAAAREGGTVEASEAAVLERLRAAAAEAGAELGPFVDALLAGRAHPAAPVMPPEGDLVGEMKGLFERLARDIPAQLARGMESAFRDVAPRLAAAPPPAGAVEPARPAAELEVVRAEPAPREVPSYRSRRAKAPRRKL